MIASVEGNTTNPLDRLSPSELREHLERVKISDPEVFQHALSTRGYEIGAFTKDADLVQLPEPGSIVLSGPWSALAGASIGGVESWQPSEAHPFDKQLFYETLAIARRYYPSPRTTS